MSLNKNTENEGMILHTKRTIETQVIVSYIYVLPISGPSRDVCVKCQALLGQLIAGEWAG